ncbi:MAG: transglutaminase domain-containing protein [Ruminococcaceae bacterium]|nr:transglutaminase domain-containing protein [Oscillospiraceae bacterium]
MTEKNTESETEELTESSTEKVSEKVSEKETEADVADPAPRPILLEVKAPGTFEKRNALAVIDYSNCKDGYVMAKFSMPSDFRIKAQVKGTNSTYTYNMIPEEWEVFPLSEGSGSYKISIYQNVEGTKYATVLSVSIDVSLENEFSTFLYPNQYVDYISAPNTVEMAYQLTKYTDNPLEKVALVYDYVVDTLRYDKAKAENVQSGYLPVLDEVLENKKGICFDYAALMTGMLRSQGIPCKLVVGYAGSAYHAWISVWTEESGWIDGAIFFDGSSWHRMDPTFASSSDRSDYIMQYIGDGKNYTAKYLY